MKEKDKTEQSARKKIKKALEKKALGYDFTEVVEEYSEDGEGIKLTKKRITKKNVPPDISALKMLLEEDVQPLSMMTDEQLKEEKERLLKLLKNG